MDIDFRRRFVDEFVNSLETSDDGDEASSDEISDSEDTQDEGIEISISEKDGIRSPSRQNSELIVSNGIRLTERAAVIPEL